MVVIVMALCSSVLIPTAVIICFIVCFFFFSLNKLANKTCSRASVVMTVIVRSVRRQFSRLV